MLKEKLIKKFGEKRLWMQFSALQDEDKMRKTIEYCLKHYPRKQNIAVETGTFHGVSASLLAEYFDKIYTFDATTGYVKEENIKYEIWDYLGIRDKIQFYLIKDDVEKNQILKTLNYNFAFVDGKHVGGVSIDYELLKGCGRLLFHDYIPNLPLNNMRTHIVNFVNSLGKNIVYTNPPFALWIGEKK